MVKFLKLLLPFLFIAGIAFGGARDKRTIADQADERQFTGQTESVSHVLSGWLIQNLDLATSQYKNVEYLSGGIVWLSAYSTTAPEVDFAYRSTDDGATWTKSVIATPGPGLCNIAAKDANTAIVGMYDGRIMRTTNGGARWDSVYYYGAGSGFMDGVKFMGDTVIAYGDAADSVVQVVRSTNAGATWTRITNLPAGTKNYLYGYATYGQGMDVFGQTVWISIYASGYDPGILKSTDAGLTWSLIVCPLTGGTANNYYFRSIHFKDANIGYAMDRQPGSSSSLARFLHKTTNGGLTWSDTINVEPGVVHANASPSAVKAIRGTSTVVGFGLSAATGPRTWWSTDDGTTWTPMAAPMLPGLTPAALYNGSFLTPTQGYAVGTRNVLKYTTGTPHFVTFMVNTSTVPDTLLSSVTITGDKAAITNWGAGAPLTKIGGDYWKGTVQFNEGDSVRYKIRVNGNWEANPADPNGLSPDNRGLILGTKDTVLPLQFFNNKGNGTPQYFRPWPTVPDSFINIWFRTNMQGFQSKPFNSNTDTVGVRGDKHNSTFNDAADFGWAPTRYLTRENSAANGGFSYNANNFWSGVVKLRKSLINVGDTVDYKFLIGFDWGREEQGNNRFFKIPVGKADTTLAWTWYNNERPVVVTFSDTCVITFKTNMSTAISHGGFSIGDTIQVQSGWFGTAIEQGRTRNLLRQGLTNLYQYTDTIITKVGNLLDYQYYVVKNGISIRENYFNFQFTGPAGNAEQERRQITVASKNFTVLDTVSKISDARRQPDFANQSKLAKNVKVMWEVDMRPAYYEVKYGGVWLNAIQGPDTLKNVDSIRVWGVSINGPATGGANGPLATDWATWDRGISQDSSKRKMWDDGPAGGHGDAVAGDSLFTVTFRYTTANVKGQVFKFGIRGSDNESGFGLNHLENISDADTVYTIHAQWGSINPNFYSKWDYDLRKPRLTSVDELPGVPLVYSLEQNYPNPFNPSTRIEFSIPATSNVVLKVYNILGQEVVTLVNESLKVGNHAVTFDASRFASGVYLYRLTAGQFVSTKKMLLLK